MNLIGIDLGSSSIKVALVEALTGKCLVSAQSPDGEMGMVAEFSGWAEQNPALWLAHLESALNKIKATGHDLKTVAGIGISYQMHGLVLVDEHLQVLRPSIIWCDSRAVQQGEELLEKIGQNYAVHNLLNNPGNFTASKLAWVKANEPELFSKVKYAMLPGDWLATTLTGIATTTFGALSEGIFIDYTTNTVSESLLKAIDMSKNMLPVTVGTFARQGKISIEMSERLGISANAEVTYRAGDQPNNAFSLNVINPGEVATNAGTSGVVYAVTNKLKADSKSRINLFAHVNHTSSNPRLGILACLNGTGIAYSWLRKLISDQETISYARLNSLAASSRAGSKSLKFYPFGNGTERFLENKPSSAGYVGLQFNEHAKPEMVRATLEGISFALKYGVEIMSQMEFVPRHFKAGNANMFQSQEFQKIFSTIMGTPLTIYNSDGAIGAARASGVGLGLYSIEEAAKLGLNALDVIEPDSALTSEYEELYQKWKENIDTVN